MLGGLLAGTDEAPGEVEMFEEGPTNPIEEWVQLELCRAAPKIGIFKIIPVNQKN